VRLPQIHVEVPIVQALLMDLQLKTRAVFVMAMVYPVSIVQALLMDLQLKMHAVFAVAMALLALAMVASLQMFVWTMDLLMCGTVPTGMKSVVTGSGTTTMVQLRYATAWGTLAVLGPGLMNMRLMEKPLTLDFVILQAIFLTAFLNQIVMGEMRQQ